MICFFGTLSLEKQRLINQIPDEILNDLKLNEAISKVKIVFFT